MPQFSANLGFLWPELPLVEAIQAAKKAGFDAVECHWPYDVSPQLVKEVLSDNAISMLGINTRRGDVEAGDNGLSALPDRVEQARAAIDEAVDYAVTIGCSAIHVMAGYSSGYEAEKTFIENLDYACLRAKAHDITILIEPLNKYDAPGYFLSTTDYALQIIEAVGRLNIKLMFDFYHVQLMEGDLANKLIKLMPYIGHIQFASVPDRGPPDDGEIDFAALFKLIDNLGYKRPIGAEYKPNGPTEQTFDWLRTYS